MKKDTITVNFEYGTMTGETGDGEKIDEDYVIAHLPDDCLLALADQGLTVAIPKDFFDKQDYQEKFTVTLAWHEIKIFSKMLELYEKEFGSKLSQKSPKPSAPPCSGSR